MRGAIVVPSLRRSLVASVLVTVAVATVAMIGGLSATVGARRAVDHDTDALLGEQRTADEIVLLSYQQQLEALRYVAHPDSAARDAFQRLGDDADAHMRRYLFLDLSTAARLQVEVMKERHASFEVAAQRALELADRGDLAAARARMLVAGERGAALDSSVGQRRPAPACWWRASVARRWTPR